MKMIMRIMGTNPTRSFVVGVRRVAKEKFFTLIFIDSIFNIKHKYTL